jgi:hypothetical protein
MRFIPPIQLHPSCDPVDLLPLLRDAEEGDARALSARRNVSSVMAYIARSDGSDMGAAAVRWALDGSEIVYIGILPTPLREDGSRMRDMLMLRLNVTEVAAR